MILNVVKSSQRRLGRQGILSWLKRQSELLGHVMFRDLKEVFAKSLLVILSSTCRRY